MMRFKDLFEIKSSDLGINQTVAIADYLLTLEKSFESYVPDIIKIRP